MQYSAVSLHAILIRFLLQNVNLQTLLMILGSIKANEIPNVVKGLSQDLQDNLMKYLYKGMIPGYGDVNTGVLLSWHEKVVLSRLDLDDLMLIWLL